MASRFYVTTPIYYINDVPHLGSAYTTIAADVLARYHRLRGDDTRFLTGTDEHGVNIQRVAQERKLETQVHADEISQSFRDAWPKLGCAPDDFIRTTEERHKKGAAELWRRIQERGDIYLGHYEGLYCSSCEAYYTEKELVQPGNACPIHKRPAELLKEESYFFRLSKYGERLLAFYEAHPTFVQPTTRLNEVTSFVKGGLQDLAVSRTTFRWGIPVPGDPRHVMWVWIDALSNYWTAVQEPPELRPYWPAVHLVGKDILRFHAVYWPAFLMAAGFPDAELPRQVFAHGFLTYGGQKMSKTLRNTVSPVALAEAISPAIGADVVRYTLMRGVSFGQDGDFSIDDLLARYAADLGNTLGNLNNRVLHLADGTVPARGDAGPLEADLVRAAEDGAKAAAEAFDANVPTRALDAIWQVLAAANLYVDKAAPWVAKKKDPARLATILATLIGLLDGVTVMVAPVLPKVADLTREQLGLAPLAGRVGEDQWPFVVPTALAGRAIQVKPPPIFPRFEKEHEAALRAQFAPPRDDAAPAAPAAEAATAKAEIAYDDFARVDLRAGVVVAATKVPKKDKLVDLRVDLGEAEPRRIVAGIALGYAAESLVGQRVVVVANLAPRDFGKGLVSHGMLLATGEGPGVRLVAPDATAAPGTRVK